ncbi:MAG: uncharacterized protein A8A55_2213 [Amphiamblys sp. WSBS2006]|nr:MAG: uncharacterized protein A8A55_2213 [Amphiamblys sp. WSBS2006]
MDILQAETFARHSESCFLELHRGVFIAPNPDIGVGSMPKAKRRFFLSKQQKEEETLRETRRQVLREKKEAMKQALYERKKEKLEAMKQTLPNPKNEDGESCTFCGEENTNSLLCPFCKAATHPFFVCLECLDRATEKEKKKMRCPYCKGDTFAIDTYMKITEEIAREEAGLTEEEVLGILRPYTPDYFELAATLPREETLLTERTTVTLKNIKISSHLFFVLLRKTKIHIGRNSSIFEHAADGDCIIENSILGDSPPNTDVSCFLRNIFDHEPLLKVHGENENNTGLGLENIKRIPQNSIGCDFSEIVFTNTALTNILPKLKLDSVKRLTVAAEKKEHVAPILTQDQNISVWRIEKIELKGYAVAVVFSLEIQECGLLILAAEKEEHVAPIPTQRQMIRIGRIQKMELRDYAVSLLLSLEIQECCVLMLDARERGHVTPKLTQEHTIPTGGTKKIILEDYAVAVLLSLEILEGDALLLDARRKEDVTPILEQEQKIRIGRIQKIELREYAVAVVLSLEVQECGLLILEAWRREHTPILEQEQKIPIGGIQKIELREYAVNVLPKLQIPEDGELRELLLKTEQDEYVAGIPAYGQEIPIGGIQKITLKDYAVSVLPKLQIPEDGELRELLLKTEQDEHVAGILEQKIPIGGIQKIELERYAVGVLPKLEILEDGWLRELGMAAWKTEHVEPILEQRKKIPIGGIQKIKLRDYAVGVLLKLQIQGDGGLRELEMAAWRSEYVASILAHEQMIRIGGIQKITLKDYTVNVLPKLEIQEDSVLEELVLGTWKDRREYQLAEILSVEDESINVWDVKVVIHGGCQHEIRKKLKGTNIAIMPVE